MPDIPVVPAVAVVVVVLLFAMASTRPVMLELLRFVLRPPVMLIFWFVDELCGKRFTFQMVYGWRPYHDPRELEQERVDDLLRRLATELHDLCREETILLEARKSTEHSSLLDWVRAYERRAGYPTLNKYLFHLSGGGFGVRLELLRQAITEFKERFWRAQKLARQVGFVVFDNHPYYDRNKIDNQQIRWELDRARAAKADQDREAKRRERELGSRELWRLPSPSGFYP